MKTETEKISGAIFLIGLGLLLVTGWWFPGILFVIGISSLVGAVREDSDWRNSGTAIWMIGLGLIFWLNLPWAMIFVMIGLSMLFCNKSDDDFGGKRKNDHKPKNDDYDIV
ncbi:MAG: hypothetical protein Phog2KO_09830 [Phototrophicaceae bacterium]